MKMLNLKNEYSGAYKVDYFVSVSDEVADYFISCHRLEHSQREKLRYNQVCSLPVVFGTAPTNVEVETENRILAQKIKHIIQHELKTSASSVRAYYFFVEEYSIAEISNLFHIDKSTVSKSIKQSKKAIKERLQTNI